MPLAQLAVLCLGVFLAVGTYVTADAARDLFEPIVDVLRTDDPSDAEIDDAIDEVTERQPEYWWLNVTSLVPLAAFAGMAVWSNRVAANARDLGYPARRSPGWAAGGWFVPVVNLWFPYQSIVDSVSPWDPRRGRVLAWWLVYVLGCASTLPLMIAGAFTDAPLLPFAVPVVALAVAQVVLGLRVVALVHDDHDAAAAAAASQLR
jgi:hypothetical protein